MSSKVNNRIIRKKCEICSKLAIKMPERHHVDFEQLFVRVEFEQLHRISCCKKILVDCKTTSFQLTKIFKRIT